MKEVKDTRGNWEEMGRERKEKGPENGKKAGREWEEMKKKVKRK